MVSTCMQGGGVQGSRRCTRVAPGLYTLNTALTCCKPHDRPEPARKVPTIGGERPNMGAWAAPSAVPSACNGATHGAHPFGSLGPRQH